MKKINICFMALFTFFILLGNVSATNCTINGQSITIPDALVNIVSTIVTIIKIGVPIILVIMGMIDMGKAVASQKDDEIKKGQKTLISRVIAAGIVYFVVAIVQLLFNVVGGDDDNNSNIWNCISSFLNGASSSTNAGNSSGDNG